MHLPNHKNIYKVTEKKKKTDYKTAKNKINKHNTENTIIDNELLLK